MRVFYRSLAVLLLLCSPLWSATLRWRGGAAATTEEYTVTIGGTWAPGDTITITDGNSHDVVLTVDSATIETVAQELANTINASTATGNLVAAETRTAGCQSIPEFTEMTATVTGAVVTVKAKKAGMPFVFSIAETAAGTATKATVRTATGPNYFDNAENWDTGVVPGNNDTIRFDSGSVDCLYGINYMRDNDPNNLIAVHPTFTTDYTGNIGLPFFNPNGYVEYRDRALEFAATDANIITFADGINGTKGGTIRLDFVGTGSTQFLVTDCGILEVYGGAHQLVNIRKGRVILDPSYDPPTTAMTINSGLTIGGRSLRSTDTSVTISSGIIPLNVVALTVYSGNVLCNGPLWSTGVAYWIVTMNGGSMTYTGDNTEQVTICKAATFRWTSMSGSTAKDIIDVYTGGTYDVSNGSPTRVYNNTLTAHGGATLNLGGATPTITFDGCEESDVTIIR